MESTIKLNDLVDECVISLKHNEMVVFCGAGVSVNSGLPLASQLVDYILKKLPLSQDDFNCISQSGIPFEAFMRVIMRDKTDGLLEIFKLGNSNINHRLFARLVKAGMLKLIVTTNFDLLIEKAFGDENLELGRNVKVVINNSELEKVSLSGSQSQLIKIHGSIDDQESIAITLFDVASRQLSAARKAPIEQTFSTGLHKKVLILGYSCSDVFDLSPYIMSFGKGSGKEIIIIEHTQTTDETCTLITDNLENADQSKKKPFKTYRNNKHIKCNTDTLVARIWQRLFGEPPSISGRESVAWNSIVDKWFNNWEKVTSKDIGFTIAGSLLNNISEFRRALPYHEKAIQSAAHYLDSNLGGEIGQAAVFYASLSELGPSYIELGMYSKAVDILKKLTGFADVMQDKAGKAKCLGHLGRAYLNLGDYTSSLKYHKEALSMYEQMGLKQGRAEELTGLAHVLLLLGNYNETIRTCESALELAKDIGDKKCEINNLGNMALALRYKGKLQDAIDMHLQAIEIALAVSDKQAESEQFGNLGIAMMMIGKLNEALKCHQHALQITRNIGFIHGEIHALGNLGVVYGNTGDNDKSIRAFELAVERSREIGDRLSEARCLFNLGITQKHLGMLESSYESCQQALGLYETLFESDHPEVIKVKAFLDKM